MKPYGISIIFLITVLFVLTGCSSSAKETQKQTQGDTVTQPASGQPASGTVTEAVKEPDPEDYVLKEGTTETIDYDSKAIADNLIEENTVQKLYVYLPPTYLEGDKAYPVVYFLHGFGESPASFVRYSKSSLDPAFSRDSSKEFIVVAVEGTNSAGGSYYINSPVTGKWGDYTWEEVVTYIDSNYRTLANARSRGICGFSMGGFGALNLAFLHPEVYGATYAMSPGVLAPGKIGDALDSWRSDYLFLKAYSLAFAYNSTPPYETTPLRDGSDSDNALLERWEAGFGDWEEKLQAYQALKTPLQAIGLSYGINDSYGWIPEGTKYLSGLLDKAGIEHTLFSFEGGHAMPPNTMEDHLLPFFQASLSWE